MGGNRWRWIKIIAVSHSKYLCVILCLNPPGQTGGDRGLPWVLLRHGFHHSIDDAPVELLVAEDTPGKERVLHELPILTENQVKGIGQLLQGRSLLLLRRLRLRTMTGCRCR